MSEVSIKIKINGEVVEAAIDERLTLLEFIRDVVGLTGTKNGCFEAKCGCCTVHLDGMAVKSCNMLALQADGREVTTIEGVVRQGLYPVKNITAEGLATMYKPLMAMGIEEDALTPLQKSFRQHGALQCGFCTPGMVMAALAFLQRNPNPTAAEVREGMSGNLCRCTGYQSIVDAILDAQNAAEGHEGLHSDRPAEVGEAVPAVA